LSDSADITPEDRAAIVEVIHRSRIAIWTHDFEAYATCFVHAGYLTRWNASRQAGIFRREGWDDIAARVQRAFKDETLRIAGYAFDARVENLQLRISGDMAWATFDQIYPSINMDHHYYPGGASHEVRVFERQDGRWLIAFLGVMHGSVGRYDTPILHVTPEGEVTWQSPAAAVALAEDDDLTIRSGRVRFRDSRADRKLKAALQWAVARDQALLPKRGTLPIVVEAGEGLPAKVYWVFAEGGQIIISLHVAGIDEARLDVAAAIFGLSPAQKEAARLVVEGLSHREIAERLAISANTVRTHLNRVFEKTGVRTQSALVRVLLSSAPPV